MAFFSSQHQPDAFWANGPRPGGGSLSFLPGPGAISAKKPSEPPRKHTQYPTVAGTSILAFKYKDGVIMASDTLGSYGSCAMYRDLRRMRIVGKSTIVGGSGDMADFDSLARTLEEIEIEYDEWADGHEIQPKSVHQTVTRIMYNRRSKMDPLWNTLVVGGFNKDGPYLGYCDKVGVAYTDDTMASGYGAHIALPIIRAAYEANPEMSEEEATKLINRCLNVMFYRDARTFNRYQIAIANANGVSISEPYSLETNWKAADMVIPIP